MQPLLLEPQRPLVESICNNDHLTATDEQEGIWDGAGQLLSLIYHFNQ